MFKVGNLQIAIVDETLFILGDAAAHAVKLHLKKCLSVGVRSVRVGGVVAARRNEREPRRCKSPSAVSSIVSSHHDASSISKFRAWARRQMPTLNH